MSDGAALVLVAGWVAGWLLAGRSHRLPPPALFLLWNPPGLFAAMAAYAVLANAPCIVVQRFNRARILRVRRRRAVAAQPA